MQSPHKLLSALVLLLAPSTGFAQLTVNGSAPGINAGNIAPDTDIVIHFDRALQASSLPPVSDDIQVFGKATGPAVGTWTLENGGLTARFDPDVNFGAGEVVQVTLSNQLTALDGTLLRSAGYTFEFRIRARANDLNFEHLETMSVRSSPGQGTRVYGGQACDLNDDGWVDLAIVDQDTSDVRVLLNKADSSGRYDPFLTPVNGTGSTPSPNEGADMNGDGLMDIVTGNKFGDDVSVLIGRGDGTFDPAATYSMGDLPRGLALLDFDGDGDTDVVCANANSGNLSLRANNGDGTLGPETTMEGGGSSEWGLAAGDMNEDGILDLVVGAQSSERIIVWLGDGDGTFTQAGIVNNVDRVWMIVLGDVNGDGHLDASVANGTDNTASILIGDGSGNLALTQMVSAPAFNVATDLGDLDGDGDLDWILSGFSGGRWVLWENDGAGNFTLQQQWFATSNPACAVILDFDGDLDLDLALLDEIADEVVLYENVCPDATTFCSPIANSTGIAAFASFTGSCAVGANDLTLSAAPVPNNFGFFFYGMTTTGGNPVGNGILCLANPVYRSQPALAVGNVLEVPFDLSNPPVPAATILPGSTWNFQAVFRDVPAGGAQFNFSEGLTLQFF